jgi:predicted Zn-dependent peptidase
MPRTLETNAGIATFLQTEEFFGLGLDYDLRVPDLLMAVTRDQVHEAARRTLVPANATMVVAGPYAGNAR